jgi:hypothetical protein
MAKVLGLREQRVQFFYDTDFISSGVTASTDTSNYAVSQKNLFSDARAGNLLRTNLQGPGRHELMFFAVDATNTGTSQNAVTAGGIGAVSELSIWTLSTSVFQFQVDTKIEFEGPLTMTPAGGGPWGFVADTATPLITNGEPDAPSIYVLPLPIAITKRQAIAMIEKKFAWGAVDVAAAINSYTGGKLLRAYIDGYNTRDVQ